MIIAFTTSGDTIDSPLDSRFGRAPKFIILDTADDHIRVIDNTQNLNAVQGAGLQSAQNVINAGATIVITGHTGPKAFNLLTSMNVDVYCSDSLTVKDAYNAFKNGTLKRADSADVESHW